MKNRMMLIKKAYCQKQLKSALPVEMASTFGWHKYVTDEGDILGMHTFGESAPAEELFQSVWVYC